jgi:rhodanese-related sulfurtransferase
VITNRKSSKGDKILGRTPALCRPVANGERRHAQLLQISGGRKQQLSQRLRAVEHARAGTCDDKNVRWRGSVRCRPSFTILFMQHSPRFLQLVKDAKQHVRETTVDEIKRRLDAGEDFTLVDVREESEYAKDHLPGAVHLGKGIIERDIEAKVPNTSSEVVLYCGGGFRSALAADNLQKMGYKNVVSMDGGIREWREKKYPLTK